MKFHTIFDLPPNAASCAGGASLTDQSYKDECNVDVILKRFAAGDKSVVRSQGIFADVTNLQDFGRCLDVVKRANEDFAALPSVVRDRFGNDPSLLVEFLRNSDNDEEAFNLGLKIRPEIKPSIADEIVKGVTSALKEANASTGA